MSNPGAQTSALPTPSAAPKAAPQATPKAAPKAAPKMKAQLKSKPGVTFKDGDGYSKFKPEQT